MTTSPVAAPGRLPVVGHALQLHRRPLGLLQDLHAYGEVVKVYLGPIPVYVITAPELIHRFLVVAADSVEKGRVFDQLRPTLGNSIVFTEGEAHARQRRLMQPAFNRRRMPRYVDLICQEAAATASSWKPGQTVAADHEMADLALTIGVKALFSSSGLDREVLTEVRQAIAIAAKELPRRTFSPKLVEKWPIVGTRRFDAANARLRKFIADIISAYRADGIDHDDLLSVLLMARDEDTGEPLTDQQVADELVTFLLGANETMSAALAWILHELGQHPPIDQRLYTELDETLKGRAVRYEELAKLDYTRRVIQEILRLYPVWLMMYRTRCALDVGGIQLPALAEVVVSPYALHHDPRLYPDPLRFDPDRWLPGRTKGPPRATFIPFGYGSHRCAGESFAWNEMTAILTTIITRWRLEPAPGHKVRPVATGSVHPNRLPMIAIPRHEHRRATAQLDGGGGYNVPSAGTPGMGLRETTH